MKKKNILRIITAIAVSLIGLFFVNSCATMNTSSDSDYSVSAEDLFGKGYKFVQVKSYDVKSLSGDKVAYYKHADIYIATSSATLVLEKTATWDKDVEAYCKKYLSGGYVAAVILDGNNVERYYMLPEGILKNDFSKTSKIINDKHLEVLDVYQVHSIITASIPLGGIDLVIAKQDDKKFLFTYAKSRNYTFYKGDLIRIPYVGSSGVLIEKVK